MPKQSYKALEHRVDAKKYTKTENLWLQKSCMKIIFMVCFHAENSIHHELLPGNQTTHAVYYRDVMEQLLK
jgi:hypothetical protein